MQQTMHDQMHGQPHRASDVITDQTSVAEGHDDEGMVARIHSRSIRTCTCWGALIHVHACLPAIIIPSITSITTTTTTVVSILHSCLLVREGRRCRLAGVHSPQAQAASHVVLGWGHACDGDNQS